MKKREMANMFQSSSSVTIIQMPAEEVNSMGEIPFSSLSLGCRLLFHYTLKSVKFSMGQNIHAHG